MLVVCAHTAHRLRHLAGRLGGFALTSHAALERDPALAAGYAHVVLMDPGPPAAARLDRWSIWPGALQK